MAKKPQSGCKIYVKTFSQASVSYIEDYMKPLLRNSPSCLILHVGTNDLSSKKFSTGNSQIDNKSGMST